MGGERLRDSCNTDVWEQSSVVLRAARGARTLSVFPLVSELRVVSVARLTRVSCRRSPFLCRGH